MNIHINYKSQKGSMIILAVIMLAVMSLFPVISQMSRISNQQSYYQEKHSLQANEVAKAGLEDAMGWFRKQARQPVKNGDPATFPRGAIHIQQDMIFHPQYNSVDRRFSETISDHSNTDASFYVVEDSPGVPNITYPDRYIGLVSTYPVNASKRLMARYELKRYRNESDYPGQVVDNTHIVRDITHQRIPESRIGDGEVWYLESTGYIYRQVDPTKMYNEHPNLVMAKSMASTEIRYLTIKLAEKRSALLVNDFSAITLQGRGVRINGKDQLAIVAYPKCDPMPGAWPLPLPAPCPIDANRNVAPPAQQDSSGDPLGGEVLITGANAPTWETLDINPLGMPTHMDPKDMFTVDPDTLRLMADLYIEDGKIPANLPAMGITFFSGGVSDTKFPRGSGIIYVNGDLKIDVDLPVPSSLHKFNGIIYVNGNLYLKSKNGNFYVAGTVVVKESVLINHELAGGIKFNYDSLWLETVRGQVAQYRQSTAINYMHSAMN